MIATDRTLEFFQVVELLQSSDPVAQQRQREQQQQRQRRRQAQGAGDAAFAKAVNQLAFHISHVRFDLDSLQNHFRHGAALSPPGATADQKVVAIKSSMQQLQTEAALLSDREAKRRHGGGGGGTHEREHRRAVLQRILDDLKRMAQQFKGALEQHQKRSRARRSRFSKFGPDVSNSFDVQNLRQPRQPPYSQFRPPPQPAHPGMPVTPLRGTAAARGPGGNGGLRRRGGGGGGGTGAGMDSSMGAASGPGSNAAWASPSSQLAAGAMGMGLAAEDTQLIPDSVYDQTRATGVRQMEITIIEMGSMFGQLTDFVAAQDETITHIAENVDVSLNNVQEGENQLLQYWSTISSNRDMILKIFAVLVLLVLFANLVWR